MNNDAILHYFFLFSCSIAVITTATKPPFAEVLCDHKSISFV